MTTIDKLEIETVLAKFSILSPFYLKLFALIVFAAVTNHFCNFNYVFAPSDTKYRCRYPQCRDPDLKTFLIDNKCYMLYNGTCFADATDNATVVKCTQWMYEDANSFVGEFNLGCEDWKRNLVGFIHIFGYMIGLLFTGPLADKFGRKKVIILAGLISGVLGLSKSFVQTYWTYAALELFEGMFGDTYSPAFMMGVEMVTKEHRATFITIMTASTSLAGILMAAIAWGVPYWRNFLRAIYAPSFLFLLYISFLDESLRWLSITGKNDKVKDLIKKAAISSRVVINDDDMNEIGCEETHKDANNNMYRLLAKTFASKKLLLRFMACICMWTAALFNKYTLVINSVELEGNKYINFALISLSELPASLVIAFILNKYKRRMPLIYSLLLTGVFCIAQSFVPKGYVILSTFLFVVGKFMATISHSTVYLYTSELFPTYTRNTMLALASSFGRTASLLAPQTPLLMRYWRGLPSVIVGGLSLLTAVVVMLMPETSEITLPDTVREAEAVGEKKISETVFITKL